MPTLLFEIGTEELPTSAIQTATTQLRGLVADLLGAIASAEPVIYSTPRRVAALLEVVPTSPVSTEIRRGPPAERSFDADGNPTRAALGFAASCGVDASALEVREADGGKYVFATVTVGGQSAAELARDVLEDLPSRISFGKSMRWDDSAVRFSRPVRWIVAMLDDEVLDVGWGRLRAGSTSFGHRVFSPGPVKIPNAAAYVDTLAAAGVDVDRSARRDAILELVSQAASTVDGEALVSSDVLDEVTDIVERGVAFVGSFDPDYLKLPDCVLTTVMQKHQRYFPVRGKDGLLPHFVVVSNADPSARERVLAGNLRVLRARLEDARFFVESDLQRSLEDRRGDGSQITVHPKLGTVLEKSDRLAQLAVWLGEAAGAGLPADQIELAARLCKADLTTSVVFEFPELQGEIGTWYARKSGVGADVSNAIGGHYLPRTADEEPATDPLSRLLAVADRLDTLAGYLGIGLAPTGSADPFALRRAVAGLLANESAAGWSIPLSAAVTRAAELYATQGIELDVAMAGDALRDLIAGRVVRSSEAPANLAGAAVASEWTSAADLKARIAALVDLNSDGRLAAIVAAGERPANLAAKADVQGAPDPALFDDATEKVVFETAAAVGEQVSTLTAQADYKEALVALEDLVAPIGSLFEAVMIMHEDPAVKTNRLQLCAMVAGMFRTVADLSALNAADLN